MRNNKKILFVTLIISLVLFVSPAFADETIKPPMFPMQMTGSAVDANGNPLPAGTVITATVDGITSTYVVKENGKIGDSGTFGEKFLITGITPSSPVKFTVNGVESPQTIDFGSGSTIVGTSLNFDVVINPNPTQGSSGGGGKSSSPTLFPETLTQTTEPTIIPTPTPTTSSKEPTQQATTPVPVAGILAGLGAALVFGLRRK